MRNILIICVSLSLFTHSYAADKYAAEFLNYGVGARPLAMGGAYAAVADDATAAYWNPAGLASLERPSLDFMHSYAYSGFASFNSIFGVYPWEGVGTFGGGFLRLSSPDIKITHWDDAGGENRRPVVDRVVNWSDNGIYVSYGRRLLDKVQVGGNLIIILQGADTVASSFGQSFGVGVMAGPFGPMRFAIHGQNLIGRVKWNKEIIVDGSDAPTAETIPMNIKMGTSFLYPIPLLAGELLIAADCDMKFEGYESAAGFSAGDASFDIHSGGEFLIMRTVALRVGLEKRQQDRIEVGGGAGLRIRPGNMEFGVDYAFQPDNELGNSHRISASVAF
ncbi:MAG: PorV/PorQ family protein [bacterium]|nr:PorV/PorQ family protein [bacterium]